MVFSQDTYVQQGGEKFEGKAKYYLTNKYAPAFYLSGEQTVLFEKKLIEFLIREEKIRSVQM